MKHDVYLLLGKRFVFVGRVEPALADTRCNTYAKMGAIAAHMPVGGGNVKWFPNKIAANDSRFIGSVR